MSFDTYLAVKSLEEVGFTEQQATKIVDIQKNHDEHTLATKQDISEVRSELLGVRSELKQDISEVRSELKQDISEVRSELKQDISEVRSELKVQKWMTAFIIVAVITPQIKALLSL